MIHLLLKYSILLPLILLVALPAATPPTLPACSAARHAQYTTIGPDGHTYQTWHPLIDPYGGCVFDHEHGSNPALFLPGVPGKSGVWPAFGYSAAQMGMTEGDAGFKVYVFRVQGRRFMLTHHFGTANAALAACTTMHTFDVVEYDEASKTIVRQQYGMANFGAAVENATGQRIAAPCNTGTGTGVRMFPVATSGSIGYEPWRADITGAGLDARITINTFNPQTACQDITCTVNIARTDVGGPARGTLRRLEINWWREPGFALPDTICTAYGTDYWYDCTLGIDADAEFYRRNPFVTGAN